MLSNSKKRDTTLNELLSYTYPKLYVGACWYVGFYAFDPALGSMRRKRIKINAVGTPSQRKKFAASLCHRLSAKLEAGWNPWVEADAHLSYKKFVDVLAHYRNFIIKQQNDGVLRQSTVHGYMSSAHIMEKWNEASPTPIVYAYQFDRTFCVRFLDYVYIGRGNSPTTRNNNLAFLRSFSTFLVQHLYLKERPTDGIQSLRTQNAPKARTVMSPTDVSKLQLWLEQNSKEFLLVCYFIHYMFVRPREVAKLRLCDINIANQTLYLDASISKNKKSAIVTIPRKILELMIDLQYFNYPSSYYIFAKGFRPSAKASSERAYRNFWTKRVVPALKFPKSYQLYSLKDTGITAMLRAGCDTLSVKEQARHSSLLMTDVYTPQDIKNANPTLLNYNGIL